MQTMELLVVLLTATCVAATPRHIWGNALTDDPAKPGPHGDLYPTSLVERLYEAGDLGGGRRRINRARALFPPTLDPAQVSQLLLQAHHAPPRRSQEASGRSMAARDSIVDTSILNNIATMAETRVTEGGATPRPRASERGGNSTCSPRPPAQLCPTKFNTTAPMWGVSLTSGKRVTIVQRFPDLLQQVIFHECTSSMCDVIHGECRQTFTPYLFLVLPLGPVTLTGQDYVMVESGCACQPKYSSGSPYEAPGSDYFG